MQKGHTVSIGTGPRRRIDELVPGLAAAFERRVEVGDAKTDVMNAGAAPGKKLADGALTSVAVSSSMSLVPTVRPTMVAPSAVWGGWGVTPSTSR